MCVALLDADASDDCVSSAAVNAHGWLALAVRGGVPMADRGALHRSIPHDLHKSASHSREAAKHGHSFVLHCDLQLHPRKRFSPNFRSALAILVHEYEYTYTAFG